MSGQTPLKPEPWQMDFAQHRYTRQREFAGGHYD